MSDRPPVFALSRSFDAPRATVWKAYTEIEHLSRWWGPKGFTWLRGTLDLRPGGLFHYGMRAPNGAEMWGKFVYREIVALERIVFVNAFADADGGTIRAPFAPNWPLEVLNTLLFTEHDGRTTLDMTGSPVNATEEERKMFDSMRPSLDQGFKGTLDQLADYLERI
ncbi:MAG TPA: SRPBCC domain-containing protein [Rhizomicrobium sp.]